MKRYLPQIALWLALWLPWLYVGVFAYTADKQYFSFSSATGGGSGHSEQREYGWPYEWRESSQDEVGANYKVYELRYLSIAMLAVDIVISLAISVLLFVIVRKWWQAIRTRGFRFRVSTLLLLMVAVSLPLAGWRYMSNAREREFELMVELEPLGITVFDEYQGPLLLLRLERFLPENLIRMWWRCYRARLETDAFDEGQAAVVRDLKKFSRLEVLRFDSCPTQHFAILHELPNVTQVEFTGLTIDDEGIKHLQSCDHLQLIDLTECEISPEAVEQLRKALPEAEIIYDEEETSE